MLGTRQLGVLAVAALVAVSTSAVGAGAPAPNAGKPEKQKKASKLAYIVEQVAAGVARERGAGRSGARASNAAVHATADGAIEVAIWAKQPIGGRERADLAKLGAAPTASFSRGAQKGKPAVGVIQARVPYDRLDDLAALDWVATVTPPGYGESDTHPINPINSQGVALHNADDAQTRGINGAGVTVGAISDGVSNLAASQAANELPAVTVLNTGSGDEGTAMLEIVHDMAPGAALMFDTQGGVAGHAAAQANLVANGADVITEDLAFDTEPAFQSGLLASTGDAIAAAGVPVHSSAGNMGQRHAARVNAVGSGGGPDGTAGPYAGCAFTPDNAVAIAPGNDTTFDVTLGAASGSGATFVLQWSEPRAIFPTVGQGGFTDVDLYVMDQGLTMCLGQSVGFQGFGVGDTLEVVSLPAALSGTAAKVVVDIASSNGAVAAPIIDLRWRRATAVDNPTRAGSLNPDSNYVGQGSSAAALDAQNAAAIEPYSSGGPVQLITTTQCAGGVPICLGGGVAGASQTVGGPTWAAADDVSVSGVGGFGSPFTGTSAAAPHAAGCDALVRDELNSPNAATATTRNLLATTAAYIAPAGTDNVTGAGQLDCLAAINDPPVADAGGPYSTPEGTNVTLDGSASSDPDVGDSIASYEWDLDDDGFYDDATGVSPSFTAVGQDGSFTIGLRVTDTAGATDTDTGTVVVTNVAPTVGPISTNGPKPENSPVSISGAITDPGWLDPLTATIDYGDGTGVHVLAGTLENSRPDASLTYAVSRIYGDNGTFTITVCASDDDTSNNCNSQAVTVTNVSPLPVIDEAGTVIVNGVATFVTHAGVTIPFAGRATDPGSDDLSLTWDWDDGPPSPDVTTVSFNNGVSADPFPSPSINPRDVLDTQPHAFGDACFYTVAFGALDDDAGSASDSVKVIVAGNAATRRSAGYWQTQYRPRPTAFPEPLRVCYLAIAGFISSVFDEERDASTVAKAFDVIDVSGNGGSALQQLDRQLLTTWLNFANGSYDYAGLVDADGNGIPETPFSSLLAAVEAARLNPASTEAQLRAWRDVLERLNGS